MSNVEGEKSEKDCTEALFLAEVERFFKNGIREMSFDGSCTGLGGADVWDDIELELLPVEVESSEDSDPEGERIASDAAISPKYCSVNRRASSCGTPANATTILSGRKKVAL